MKWYQFMFARVIILMVTMTAIVVTADFAPPTAMPPAGNLMAPINAGSDPQVKHGPLGIQRNTSDLILPPLASLVTDSTIAVQHSEYVSKNTDWKFDGSIYALDTNAPIRTHGIFSTGPVVVQGDLTADSIKIATLKDLPNDSELCASGKDGTVSPCVEINGAQLQASITVNPTSVIPGKKTSATVTWQATASARTCTAVEGGGFSTKGAIVGSDTVSDINLAEGDTVQYVIVCQDNYGNTALAAAQIVSSEHAPKISFSVNPAVGGWSNGGYFTTGLSIDPNGGGTVSCRKKVDGAAISSTNSWSGQSTGVWSTPTSIPPGTASTINTCGNGCQFNNIVTKSYSSALMTIECTNEHASTSETRWISIGK